MKRRYLLNSAVITAPGSYLYELLSPSQAGEWLAQGPYVSTCGYPETAAALEGLCGLPAGSVPVNRATIQMAPGEEALVFRLVFPAGYRPDPAQKGKLGAEFVEHNHECGLLRRLA